MKTEPNWWTAVLSAGITAGYATAVVQLSPGPGYVFSTARRQISDVADTIAYNRDLPNVVRQLGVSAQELAYCGWCLSPWVSLPVWAMAAKINRVRFGVKWVAGWIVAAGIAAFLRHYAETGVA